MSDSYSAYCDDVEEYQDLCRRFGEKIRYIDGNLARPDCYGKHAETLKKRAHDKDEAIRVAEIERSSEYRTVRGLLVALLGRLEENGQTNVIHADNKLRLWWKLNRKEYDTERARQAAEEKRQRLEKKAKSKLSSEERKALGVS